jgi:hypothetical protein
MAERVPVRQRVIYLNREGGLLTTGQDDSSRNVSSVVGAAGLSQIEIPAFTGTAQVWEQIVSCVEDQFQAYDVAVVDQRPVAGPFVMVMVGGEPGELSRATGHEVGPSSRVRGVAPMGREPIDEAVVFVFSRSLRERARDVCETVAQEVGHAFGLDHVLDCHDPMTHLASCGDRNFQDRDIPCGEDDPRACVSSQLTQNSHRYLLDLLGPRSTSREPVVESPPMDRGRATKLRRNAGDRS